MNKRNVKTVDITVKGHTYRYEDKAYWDKGKKQGRHKRIYLGKVDVASNEVIKPKININRINSVGSRSYGAFHLLRAISEKLNLTSTLKNIFGAKYENILILAFYELMERQPMYLCENWSEENITFSNKVLYSSKISELFASITEEDKLNFFKTWAKDKFENEYVALDITSVSSYAQLLEQVEYGYNRDHEKLPQINLTMLFRRKL